MPSPHNEHEPDLSRRTTPAESGPWSADKLAAAADETETRLHRYAVAGLLHRQPDGDFEPDSLHRLRLIQFAQSRGITDEHLAAAITSQGDLLSIFDELVPAADATVSLVDVAHDLGLDDTTITDLARIMDWDDVGAGTQSDVATLQVAAKALALGMPRDALMQIVHVFADATDRLADAIVRTFHNYVHERFRAQGLTGRTCWRPARQSANHCSTSSNPPLCISTGGPISAPTAKTYFAISPSRPHRRRPHLARSRPPSSSSIWPALPH